MEDASLTVHCDCRTAAHLVLFDVLADFDDSGAVITVSVQLNPFHPWWKRVYYAVRYALGDAYPPDGHWDTTLLSRQQTQELHQLVSAVANERRRFRG